MKLEKVLRNIIEPSWTRETSIDKNWTWNNRARGQCAVTALVVQDYVGGDLLRAEVNGTSHYWNRAPSGLEIDLTRKQFPKNTVFPSGEIRSREYVLSYPDTFIRYLRLQKNILCDT